VVIPNHRAGDTQFRRHLATPAPSARLISLATNHPLHTSPALRVFAAYPSIQIELEQISCAMQTKGALPSLDDRSLKSTNDHSPATTDVDLHGSHWVLAVDSLILAIQIFGNQTSEVALSRLEIASVFTSIRTK